MKTPSVHIVILNWNGLEDTLDCLASVEKLTYAAVETIVVDNASRDGQADAIAEKFPGVTVLKQAENLGFCGGCNVGIRHARSRGADYIMLLNNDTVVPPELVEKLLEGLATLSDAGAVSPLILEHPETDKVWFSRAVWESSEAQFSISRPDERRADFAGKAPYLSDFACGCCLFAPAAMFERNGLFDERYFAFYDEAEWCARLRQKGFNSYVIPAAFMYHKVSRSTPSLVSTYLLSRNRLLWIRENLPVGAKLKVLPLLLKDALWHAANLFGLTKKYYTPEHSRAVLRGWRHYLFGKFYKWDEKTEKIIFQ